MQFWSNAFESTMPMRHALATIHIGHRALPRHAGERHGEQEAGAFREGDNGAPQGRRWARRRLRCASSRAGARKLIKPYARKRRHQR